MLYRQPSPQCPFTAKDVEIADTAVLVGAEIEHVMDFVVKRGYLIAFRVDDGPEIDWLLIMAVLGDGIPDVRLPIASRTVGNEIKHLMIRIFHKTWLHCGIVIPVYC